MWKISAPRSSLDMRIYSSLAGSVKALQAPTTDWLSGVSTNLGDMSSSSEILPWPKIPTAWQQNWIRGSGAPSAPSTVSPTPPHCSCFLGGLGNCIHNNEVHAEASWFTWKVIFHPGIKPWPSQGMCPCFRAVGLTIAFKTLISKGLHNSEISST